MRTVENGSVENEECGKYIVWKVSSMENEECEK